jgi:hypothetical protein
MSYLGLVPFYSGLPPNVTSDFKVGSVGEGNSLADRHTKAQQLAATLCSLLRYFGQAVVAVANKADRRLVRNMVLLLFFNDSIQYICTVVLTR